MNATVQPQKVRLGTDCAAPRCPDFDSDCAYVRNHALCADGNVIFRNGEVYEMPPAAGYCPYLLGMEAKP